MNNILYTRIVQLCFLLTVGINVSLGQGAKDKNYIPNIIPPSPNAASLGKYGDIPVSYYTGIPNISIPIYDIHDKAGSHSISVSYHASGIKVAEEASRVGLGWSLNAGGVISRTIMGEDDFYGMYFGNTDLPKGPLSSPIENYQLATHYSARFSTGAIDLTHDIGDGHATEFEPDNYSFNIGGFSGKFIITRSKEVILESRDKIKIEMIEAPNTGGPGENITWKVTSKDGTIYFFNTLETSKEMSGKSHVNSWYLSKIKSVDGSEITFNYQQEASTTVYTQGALSENKRVAYIGIPCDGENFFTNHPNYGVSRTSGVNYSMVYLSSINFTNGKVTFEYNSSSDPRLDVEGDKKLMAIKIYNYDGSSINLLKYFVFNYDYFDTTIPIDEDYPSSGHGSTSKRLKLKAITEKSGQGVSLPSHEFTYNEGTSETTLPAKTSFAIDHWGYYNGKTSNVSLIPSYDIYPSTSDQMLYQMGVPVGDERESNPYYAQAYTLKKITYPTGGQSEFTYEANDFDIANSQTRDKSILGQKGLLDVSKQSLSTKYNIQKKGTIQTFDIDLTSGVTTGNLTKLSFTGFCRFPIRSTSSVLCKGTQPSGKVYFQITNTSTGSLIANIDMLTTAVCPDNATDKNGCADWICYLDNVTYYAKGVNYINEYLLEPAKYTIKLYMDNSESYMDFVITTSFYEQKSKTPGSRGYAGSLRIKNIKNTDGTKTEITNFKYELIDPNVTISKSSGIRMAAPQYSYWERPLDIKVLENAPVFCTTYLDVLRRVSSSIFPLNASASGSIVGYSVVTVEKSSGEGGKTVYYYDNKPDVVNNYGYFKTPSRATIPYENNGKLLLEEIYNTQGQKLKDVKYSYVSPTNSTVTFWGLEKRSQQYVISNSTLTRADEFFFYPSIVSTFSYLKEKTERMFDPSNLTDTSKAFINKESYIYDENLHYQIKEKYNTTSIIFPDATSQRLQTIFKYPSDFATTGNIYDAMIQQHNYTPVVYTQTNIETRDENNQAKFSQIFAKTTTYNKWKDPRILNTISYPAFYAPQTITTQQGINDPIREEVRFLSYDDYGNLTKYKDKKGLTTFIDYYTDFSTNKGVLHLPSKKYTGGGSSGQTLSDKTVTKYTYYPLIGTKSIEDANQKVTTYNYDNFGRLSSVSDANGLLKSYTYHYRTQGQDFTPIGKATGLVNTIQECKLCCMVEADASSNSPIQNCTNGQIFLSAGQSSSGTDITYLWTGPNGFTSSDRNPIISTNLASAGGVYTLKVTKSNTTCEVSDIATTTVVIDCVCPFTINTAGSTSVPLNCQETISLVGNCVNCSTGDLTSGAEMYVTNGKFDNTSDKGFLSECGTFFTTNPQLLGGGFNSFGDHTGNTNGNMLLIGHSESTNERVWYQTIAVKPNTRYILSSWIAPAYNNNNTTVNWDIDGLILNESVNMANKNGGQWTQLKSVWISGSQTSVTITLRKQNVFGHNWFALDDISMTEVPTASTFSWTGPDNFQATGKNVFVRNVGLKNSGRYTLTVSDKGCTQFATVDVTVNCQPCMQPLTVYANSNTPVSCGSPINFQASANQRSVNYTWYKLKDDGGIEDFPTAEKNKQNPTITAPSNIGLSRYGYVVYAYKNGCTAYYTTPVEVRCIQNEDTDIAMNIRAENGNTSVTQGQQVLICADVINQSANGNASSVRAEVLLPDCLEFDATVSPWGFNTGAHQELGGTFYEDIWYDPISRKVSNNSTIERRGANAWQYWGVPVGANQTRMMCFAAKALSSATIVVKGQITSIQTIGWQNKKDKDSEPNNGFDNGEDDRAVLTYNPATNSIDLSTYQIRESYLTKTNEVDITSTNSNWTATISDPTWISLNKTTGGNGLSTIVITLTTNLNAKARYGFVTISAGCGLSKIIKIKQAGKDDCPSIELSSNNPYCGDQLKLFSTVISSTNKDLITNGSFEKGDQDFSSESFHYYNPSLGGTSSYVVSANPKTETGTGMWFIDQECPGDNSNPSCQIVNRVRLLFRNDCCLDRLNGARIQGSNNKSKWVDLYTFGNATGSWQDISFTNTAKYMYVRFVASNNGYGELREIEFYNNNIKLSGQLFGSPSVLGNYALQNAYNGLETALWHSTGTGENAFVGLELSGCSMSGNLSTSPNGNGKQLAVAASWKSNERFWSQTILVDPYTNYNLSLKAVQLGNYDNVPVTVKFEIEGTEIGVQGLIPVTGCTWQKISGTWNSGEYFGPVKVSLRFLNPNANGKLFAVDDISIKPSGQGGVSNSPITYSWSAPNQVIQQELKTANIPNPVIDNVKSKHVGTYSLTATQNNCPITETIDVDVACSSISCPAPTLSSPFAMVCVNLKQTAIINAYGCPLGSTVKWSDGQTSLPQAYTDPTTGLTTTKSTINTPQLQQGVYYSAQCQTDCGTSNKSDNLFIHAVGTANPPVILGNSVVEKYPGDPGTILTATGCAGGIIKWSNGTTGQSTWIPSLGFNIGTYVNVTANCLTECGESNSSNTVKIIVACNALNPSYAKVIDSPSCTSIGGTATLEGSCSNGTTVWYKDGDPTFRQAGNRIYPYVASTTTFKARCELSSYCVSDFINVTVNVSLKLSKPVIISQPNNEENTSQISVPVNTNVLLMVNNCPSSSSVSWIISGYSISNATGSSISITPNGGGVITAQAKCSQQGQCDSDYSDIFSINVINIPNCTLANTMSLLPNTPVVPTTVGTSQSLSATGCVGGVLRWFDTIIDDSHKLAESTINNASQSLIISASTSAVGNKTYIATCNIQNCVFTDTRQVNVTNTPCSITSSLAEGQRICGQTSLNATSNKINVSYSWSYKVDNTSLEEPIGTNTASLTATNNGMYRVSISDIAQPGCISSSSWLPISVLTSISAIPNVSGSATINSGQSTVILATGCPSGTSVIWSDGSTQASHTVSPSVTTSYTARCKDINSNCIGGTSPSVTINVNTGCTLSNTMVLSPTSPIVSVSQGSNQSLSASGCIGGVIQWYSDAIDPSNEIARMNIINSSQSLSINVNTSSIGSRTYFANCNIQNCEFSDSRRVNVTSLPCSISSGSLTAVDQCLRTVLTSNTNKTNVSYNWYYKSNSTATEVALSGTLSTFQATQDGTYRVVINDLTQVGCSSSSPWSNVSIRRSVSTIPTVNGTTTINKGQSATITALGCPSGTSVLWSDGSNLSSRLVTPTVTTIYTAKCIETNTTCESNASNNVVVTVICDSNTPTLSYQSPTSKVCPGGSITIAASNCNGTIKWYTSASATTPIASGNSYTTTQSEIWATCTTSTSICGESNKVSIVTQIDFGTVSITPDCDFSQLVATPNDNGNYSYTWLKDGVTIPNANYATISPSASGTYVVTITRNGTSCSKSSAYTVDLSQNKRPTVALSVSSNACGNKTLTATIGNTPNAPGPYSIVWLKDNVVITGASTTSYVASESATYKIVVTSAEGCSSNTSTPVTVINNIPTPTIFASRTCYGGTALTLSQTGCVAPLSTVWSTGSADNGKPSISVSPNTTTAYWVKCVNGACSGNTSANTTISTCLPLDPMCGMTISANQINQAVYDRTFNYTGINGNMTVTFETYCVPDKLDIRITRGGTTFSAVNGNCMGWGYRVPTGSYPCPTCSNESNRTYSFSVQAGDAIRVIVTPLCISADYYIPTCTTGITDWTASFTCPGLD